MRILGNKSQTRRDQQYHANQYETNLRPQKQTKHIGHIGHIGRPSSKTPIPLDDRPDLSQCQPCICPKIDIFQIVLIHMEITQATQLTQRKLNPN